MAIVIKNMTQVLGAIDADISKIEQAAQYAVGVTALAIERQAKINADTGSHPRGQGHVPGTGPGPNRVTGTLINSIMTEVRYGFGTYTATVGPTVEYARAVELGSSRWKSGVKYPFLFPAARDMANGGKIQRLFLSALLSKIRGL